MVVFISVVVLLILNGGEIFIMLVLIRFSLCRLWISCWVWRLVMLLIFGVLVLGVKVGLSMLMLKFI